MAPPSSVLAWRIQGMGEPGGLLSMGSHRVRHDWSDLAAAAAAARKPREEKGERQETARDGGRGARPLRDTGTLNGHWREIDFTLGETGGQGAGESWKAHSSCCKWERCAGGGAERHRDTCQDGRQPTSTLGRGFQPWAGAWILTGWICYLTRWTKSEGGMETDGERSNSVPGMETKGGCQAGTRYVSLQLWVDRRVNECLSREWWLTSWTV